MRSWLDPTATLAINERFLTNPHAWPYGEGTENTKQRHIQTESECT